MHFIQRLCVAGKVCFSHSLFMNIHVFHKCLILSEQSCDVSFVGGLGLGSSRVGLNEPGASRPPWRWQREWAGGGGPARFLAEQLEQLVVSIPELGQSWRSASQNGGERARPGARFLQ